MAKRQVDLLLGTLDLLVLKSLALGPQNWQRISLAITTALNAT